MLSDCRHRVEFGRDDLYFCRHPRVHSSMNLVRTRNCGICSHLDGEVDKQRPVPEHLHELAPRPWRYIRTQDLANDAVRLAAQLPDDLDGIIGLARSGLVPAAAIATILHLPLLSFSPEVGLVDLGAGGRFERRSMQRRTLAVVDDSVFGGIAMGKATTSIRRLFPQVELIRVAIYVRPESRRHVDLSGQLVPHPHLFEWNLFNCQQAKQMAVDFDGVLCEDWQGDEEADPDRYQNHLLTAKPLQLPRRSTLPLVVTARLERHRGATLEWLARHRVRVERLEMGPWDSVRQRRRKFSAGRHKGEAYRQSDCRLFVESCPRQAREIFEVSKKPVLSLTNGEVWH